MIMKIESAIMDADGARVQEIEGGSDGWFKVTSVKNGKEIVKVFDDEGKEFLNPKSTAIAAVSGETIRCFNIGCAVRQIEGENAWRLFAASGRPLWFVQRVVDFVGDGNILVSESDKVMQLHSFGGKVLVNKPIVAYEKFVNGCFVLTFSDGTERMYSAEGNVLSVATQDAEFLPDGCFVQYEGNLLGGVYRPDGILDRREVYSFEKAGNYYLFTNEFETGVLYNDESKEIGKNYVLIQSRENFCLFKHDGGYELFNQFGLVAKFFEQ